MTNDKMSKKYDLKEKTAKFGKNKRKKQGIYSKEAKELHLIFNSISKKVGKKQFSH